MARNTTPSARTDSRRRFIQMASVPTVVAGLSVLASRVPADVPRGSPPEGNIYNLADFHDPEDPTADVAFGAVLAAIAAAGDEGAVLFVPGGDWYITNSVTLKTPGTTITGQGVRQTRIIVQPDITTPGPATAQVVPIQAQADGITIERMTLVGHNGQYGTSNYVLGHGIRVGDHAITAPNSLEAIRIRDIVIEYAGSYGIELARNVHRLMVFENVTIRRCHEDGLDFKNADDTSNCGLDATFCNGEYTHILNLVVDNHHFNNLDPNASADNGLDMRGALHVENIDAIHTPSGNRGIVFRSNEYLDRNGQGALWTTVQNYYVQHEADPASALEGATAYGAAISNGFIT